MRLNNWLNNSPTNGLKLMAIDKEIVDKYIQNRSTEPYVKKTVENGVIHYNTIYNEYYVKEEQVGNQTIYYVYLINAHS